MLDFPNSPTLGTTYLGPNGVVWSWDGAKWINGTVGTSTAYAPLNSPNFIGNPTAPNPVVGDADTSLATTSFVAAATGTALSNVGRNLVMNPLFNIAQRGIGPWTAASSNTADRWIMGFAGGSLSTSINAMNDTNRAQIGDEAATQSLVGACVGGVGATDETYFEQRMENVRRTAGKTITLSFWALAASGTPKLGCMLYQIFGSGGSPSGAVVVPGQAVTLSTTYTRYSQTFTLPSVAGKTFGTTAGTDYLGVRLVMSAGATSGANYGNPGVQSATFVIWGVQLEVSPVATPLDYGGSPQQQLAACQRFFQVVNGFTFGGYGQNANAFWGAWTWPVTMHHAPTVTPSVTNAGNASAPTIYGTPTASAFVMYANITAGPGQAFVTLNATASADL